MNNFKKLIKDWASSQYGLAIPDEIIECELDQLMKAHDLQEENYLKALRAKNPNILNATIDALTVQESYFFRDASLFQYLKTTLLPKIIKTKLQSKDYELNIWSAGCAFGEEIYSIAIYLDQLLDNVKQWNINLLATDINEFALLRGKNGAYTRSSMRATDNRIIRDYFEPGTAPYSYSLNSRIREMVKFQYCNIINSQTFPSKKYDFIFCRNVFIYFNKTSIKLALTNFYNHLIDDGLLFLGPSDLISYRHHDFSVEMNGSIYQLRKTRQKDTSIASLPKPKKVKYSLSVQDGTEPFKIIRSLLDQKKYQQSLEIINHYSASLSEEAIFYRYKGEALIGLGDIATAIFYLKKSIDLDPMDATKQASLSIYNKVA